MPPKKKVSKADEDRFELVRLRYHVEESEQRIMEQAKTIQHLRDLHSHKTGEYENLQVDSDRLAGDYQRNLDYMEEELSTKEEALTHEVAMLKLELFRVSNELDCCKTFADENLQLKQSVRQLREELDSKEEKQADELFRQKKEAFKQQGALEQELQRMVSEMGEKYRKEAFGALAEESKDAIVQQGQLQLKFLKQDETVLTMNERVVMVEDANKHLKIELDLTSDNFHTQTVRTQKQAKQLEKISERNFSLERDVRVMKIDATKAKVSSKGAEKLAADLEAAQKKLKTAERKAGKWKSRAMDIARLSAASPHAATLALHGTFGAPGRDTPTAVKEDSDEGGEWEEQEEEEDLRAIWHAAFTPVKVPRKVSTAPLNKGRKKQIPMNTPPGYNGIRGLQQLRGGTATGTRSGTKFANFEQPRRIL